MLAEALQQPSLEVQTAVLFPSLSQLELLHGLHPEVEGWAEWVGGGGGLCWCLSS